MTKNLPEIIKKTFFKVFIKLKHKAKKHFKKFHEKQKNSRNKNNFFKIFGKNKIGKNLKSLTSDISGTICRTYFCHISLESSDCALQMLF
jgi:hypothetical protein